MVLAAAESVKPTRLSPRSVGAAGLTTNHFPPATKKARFTAGFVSFNSYVSVPMKDGVFADDGKINGAALAGADDAHNKKYSVHN